MGYAPRDPGYKSKNKFAGRSPIGTPGILSFFASFETGEVGDINIHFPFAVKITKIRAIVTKAIAATDDGTITPKNNAGTTMTDGVITATASDAVGVEYSSSPSANNTIAANAKMTLTVAKTTKGGKVHGTIEYTTT